MESGFTCGYCSISKNLKDLFETCDKNRVQRIMHENGIQSQRGYKKHKGFTGGNLSHVAPNTLDSNFDVDDPNKLWV